jgi:hypothetical protein
MAEVPGIRRALGEISPGQDGVRLELRSGESVNGEFVGFDGRCAVIRTAEREEEIEAEEVIGMLIDVHLDLEGPD